MDKPKRERGEEGREKRQGKDKERGQRKLLFWNVAGIGNKDKEFWRYIRTDFISLSETWMEKGWKKIRGRLSDTHKWTCSYAIKEGKKGKARSFIIRKKNWDLAG